MSRAQRRGWQQRATIALTGPKRDRMQPSENRNGAGQRQKGRVLCAKPYAAVQHDTYAKAARPMKKRQFLPLMSRRLSASQENARTRKKRCKKNMPFTKTRAITPFSAWLGVRVKLHQVAIPHDDALHGVRATPKGMRL